MARARLEALITIPASTSLTVDPNDGGGPDTVNLTAATYYMTALLAHLETQIEAATGSAFTVTCALGDAGTAIITVAKNAGSFKAVFGSLGLANLFGVASTTAWNGSFQASWSGTFAVKGVWLPDCPTGGDGVDFRSKGMLRSDAGYAVGPTGAVSAWVGNSYRSIRGMRWSHVSDRRAIRTGSALPNWEDFVSETQWGGNTYFPISTGGVAPTVKIYYDATNNLIQGADDGGDGVYRLILSPDQELAAPVPGFVGYRTIEITEAIKT